MQRKLQWSTTRKTINELIPQKINPRTITEKQISDLTRSLKKYNLVEIPAVDLDGTILAGHQRIKVMKILGRGEEVIDVRILCSERLAPVGRLAARKIDEASGDLKRRILGNKML